MESNRVFKTISILSFALITLAITIASNAQATGYEASIYESTPILVWISLTISILCGAYVTASSLLSKGLNSKFQSVGLIIVGLSTLVILLIYILRGYYLIGARGDTGIHLYWVNYVLATGHASPENYYPLTHYYITALHDFTGISVINLFSYLPAFFEVFFMASIFLLAKAVLPRKEQVILATLAGIPIVQASYLYVTPFALLVLLFPFIAYIVLRSLDRSQHLFTGLAIIIVVFAAILHPLGALVLLVLLFGIWLFQRFKAPYRGSGLNSTKFAVGPNLIVLSVVVFLGWLTHFAMYGTTVNTVLGNFAGNATYASSFAKTAAVAQELGYNVFEQFLKVWGGAAIYVTLSLISFVLIWRGLSRGRNLIRLKGLIGGYALISVVFIPFLAVNSVISPFRIIDFLLILSIIFVGFILFEFNDWLASVNKHGKTIGAAVVCALIVVVSVNGVLQLYASPYTLSGGEQNTRAEVDGNYWILRYRISDMHFIGLYFVPDNMLFTLPMSANGSTGPYIDNEWVTNAPAHLGYNNHTYMGQIVHEDSYVVFSEQNKRWYVDVYPQIASQRILPQDFAKMEKDTSLYKIYSNGGFDSWFLTASP